MQFTSDSRFQVDIQEEEAAKPTHDGETVSYIAIQQGTGTSNASIFDAGVTSDSVTHRNFDLAFGTTFASAPAFFADMQTRDGGDTATVRYRTLDGDGAQIFLEEETSRDSELIHTTEVVGYLAIELGDIFAVDPGGKGGKGGNVEDFEFMRTPAKDPIWEAVALERSWIETTNAFSHIEGS